MQTKRDQVQAHLFVMGRLASAMLRADPDAPESPNGRTNRGAAIGVIIAVLVCAGAFVFGLIKPGGKDSWRTSGDLIVNKETGARYLFLDGRLRPVRNYASALLIAGGDIKASTVITASLGSAPHGPPVGIPGAPEMIPRAADLDTGPWKVCAANRPRATGDVTVTTTLALGLGESQQIDGGRKLGSKEGLVIVGPDGTAYLLWQGSRLRLDPVSDAAEALGYGAVTPRQVSAAFIDALPQGPDLAPMDIADRGAPGPHLGGLATTIGQVFRVHVPGAEPRYHVLTREGLVPLTATEAALVLGDPRTRALAYGGGSVDVATLGADALTGHLAPPDGRPAVTKALPENPPKVVQVGFRESACADIQSVDGSTRVGLSVLPNAALADPVPPPAREVDAACMEVDSLVVKPGKGVVVRALSAGGTAMGSTTFLVTDDGVKYQLLSQETTKALGFENVEPQTLPAQLLSMLPTGPDLTPQAASSGQARISTDCGTR